MQGVYKESWGPVLTVPTVPMVPTVPTVSTVPTVPSSSQKWTPGKMVCAEERKIPWCFPIPVTWHDLWIPANVAYVRHI